MSEDSKPHRAKHPLLYVKEVGEANRKLIKSSRERAAKKMAAEVAAKVAAARKREAARKAELARKDAQSRKVRANPLPMTDEARANMAKTEEMLEIKRLRAAGKL